MPDTCVAVGCSNKGSGKHFYGFPSDPQRQRAWLQALGRVGFPPSSGVRKHHRICSDHFVSGQKSDDPSNVDFVPSLFTYKPAVKRRVDDDAIEAKRQRKETAETLLQLSSIEPRFLDKETVTDKDPNMLHLIDENTALRQQVEQLQSEIKQLKHTVSNMPTVCQFGYDFIKSLPNRDYIICYYTALQTFELFDWVCETLAVDGVLPKAMKGLCIRDRILLVLMKLKLGTSNRDLSLRFSIKEQCVSFILCTHIDRMAGALKFLIPWPDRSTVNVNMPRQCKRNFRKCRIIVDCTEVLIQRSKNLVARAQTYSNYKSHNTIKFLVGIAPSGAFTYISHSWGGRASDKTITLEDGLVEKLDHGDLVLADRGFLVAEELGVRGVSLAIPAFTKGKQQLTRRDTEKSRQLSRFRIHVERAICRLKVYKVMSTKMPISLLHYADSIAVICVALCNLRGKLF